MHTRRALAPSRAAVAAICLALLCGAVGCLVPDPGPNDTVPPGYVPPPAAVTYTGLSYGPNAAHHLDLFLPSGSGPWPVILWVHGGGWGGGDRTLLSRIVQREVSRGFALASIDYRLATATSPTFPAAVHDVKRAVRWLKAHAADYGLRADRVILSGASAGGHLAAFAAVTPGQFEPTSLPSDLAAQNSSVAGILNVVGPADLTAFVNDTPDPVLRCIARNIVRLFLGCPPPAGVHPCSGSDPNGEPTVTCSAAQLQQASVTNWIDASDPPVYLAYGGADTLVVAAQQGPPQHDRWVAANNDTYAAWYDLANNGTHLLDVDGINVTYFDSWLNGVVAGTLP